MSAPLARIRHTTGFGLASGADSYVYRPAHLEELQELFRQASRSGRQVTVRGAGRSYGDANIGAETLMADLTRMNRILNWDAESGVLDCETGVTIEQVWRHTIEDGYWPHIVSGTMFPTLGGALAMNIHGKNGVKAGTIGEWVNSIDVVWPTGSTETLTPADPLFYAVISTAGLLGVITRISLQLKKIDSGDLHVLPIAARSWSDQFDAFEQYQDAADYMVSWVDCFKRGSNAGRGLFHAAWHQPGAGNWDQSLTPEYQDLPDTVLGLVPKSMVWRFLKLLLNRPGGRLVNWAKATSARILGDGKPHAQSLVGFSFLLDYVPGWRRAYLPGGLIQYQSFIPEAYARDVYAEQLRIQQAYGLESFLGVLKRHRKDQFLFSHGVDGYSFALDFKVTDRNRAQLWRMAHSMNQLVLASGGKFYLAKDSTLTPEDFRRSIGEKRFETFARLKLDRDPEAILTHELARRLLLDPRVV